MKSPARLLIVARERESFLKSATSQFSSDPQVSVIEDRRFSDDRRHYDGGLQIHDKRRGARRARRHVDAQVRAVGFATVDLERPALAARR